MFKKCDDKVKEFLNAFHRTFVVLYIGETHPRQSEVHMEISTNLLIWRKTKTTPLPLSLEAEISQIIHQ